MGHKRKQGDTEPAASPEPPHKEEPSTHEPSDNESDAGSDTSVGSNEIVEVDFEFFDPKEQDYHAIKRLLMGVFGDDSEDFDIGSLADLCLAQTAIGSTVKMDETGDPYAFLTVLGMQEHGQKEVVGQIRQYLLKKVPGSEKPRLEKILAANVGLVLNERIINMPPQIVPPMFRMLMEELGWAKEDGKPVDFDYYLVMAPMYRETEAEGLDNDDDEDEDKEEQGRGRRPKKSKLELDAYVHAEDEFIEEFACF
ncbi:Mss4p nuclear export, partial [Coemansia sp. RSA 2599]